MRSKVDLKLFLIPVLFAGLSFAQNDLRVHKVTLVAAEPVIGKLALLPEALVFIDDDKPESSFFAPKSKIQSLTAEAETVTIQLSTEVRDRAGATTRAIVRLTTASEAAAVQRWFGSQTGSVQPANGEAAAEVLTFTAQRKKRFRGNTDGKLIVDGERVIFESVDNASESRRWDLKEIKELKLKNAFELEIRPFAGDEYVLLLSGKGMDNAQFRTITDRVTKSRTTR
jgi:hypothetical protein